MSKVLSKTTKPIAFRLQNDLYEIVERRAKRQKKKVGEYLRDKTEYDVTRPHGKKK